MQLVLVSDVTMLVGADFQVRNGTRQRHAARTVESRHAVVERELHGRSVLVQSHEVVVGGDINDLAVLSLYLVDFNNERTVLECLHRRLEITRVLHLLLLLLLLAARLAGGFAVLCLSQCGGSQKQEYAQNCDPFHMHVVLILMFKGLIV